MNELLINAKDKMYQVWDRNSLRILLWTPEVFEHKLEHIHNNPREGRALQIPCRLQILKRKVLLEE